MHSGNGPLARITRATARRVREHAGTPQEGPQEMSNALARPQITAPQEESILTSIVESTSDDQEPSEAERNTPGEREISRERAENIVEQEQSYMTTPASSRLSAYPAEASASPYFASTSKGKGRKIDPPYTLPQGRRDSPSRLTREEERRQIGLALADWTDRVEKNTEESRKAAEESRKASEALQSLRQMFEQFCTRDDERNALYTEHGSNGGTAEYERRQSVRARFEAPQSVERPRIEEEDHTSSSDPRSWDQTEHMRKYTTQMAGSRARAVWTRPHGRTSGPPTLINRRGDKDTNSDKEPSSPDSNDSQIDNAAIQWGSSHLDRSTTKSSRSTDTNLAGQPAITQPAHNMLDQDYARRSMSAQPQQLVGPITAPRQMQRQTHMPTAPPTFGQGDTDHENYMIETLRDHIRDSLMGIPNNLPEIKGL